MKTRRVRRGTNWFSRVLFVLMVGSAGCITWYGLAPERPDLPASVDHPAPMTRLATEGQGADSVALHAPGSGLPTRVIVATAGIDAPIKGVGVVLRDGKAEWDTAQNAVGHHIDSALPGQPGNVVLTGHVSVANRADTPYFAGLDRVAIGDIVEVLSGMAAYRYRVDEITQVDPDEVGVLRSDHRSRLTMITCTRDLDRRLVVVATLVST